MKRKNKMDKEYNLQLPETTEQKHDAKHPVITSFESGYSYFATHIPSGEEWYILGIDVKGNRVCAAGYPASIGELSDFEEFEKNKPLELSEVEYRNKTFGKNWL